MLAGNRIDPPMSLPWATGTRPGGDRGRRAAARAAGAAGVVPGVAGRAVRERFGREAGRELGRVGLADEHEARVPEARREPCVFALDPARVLQHLHAGVERIAGGVAHRVLHEEGNARERAGRSRRLLARAFEPPVDDRVEPAVDAFDALDRGIDELACRERAAATSSAWAVASRRARSSVTTAQRRGQSPIASAWRDR